MSFVTLDDAKRHLNIEDGYTGEDAYVTDLIGVAEDVVQGYGRISLADHADEGGKLPPALRHAILLIVGEMYYHREASADKRLHFDTFDRLSYLFIDYAK